MLKIEELETGYDKKKVLFGINLEASKGKITAIIGPNGSGKSTALKTIFGLNPIWGGKVFFKNNDITGRESKENVIDGISFVPQGNQVFDELTVLENLEIGGIYLQKKIFETELTKIVGLFPQLGERKKQCAGDLSGGEKQILALARALITNPQLVLMDEPSLGLSPKLVKHLMDYIFKINRELDVTILIVEQKVREVLKICNYIYSFKLGKVSYSGTPEILKNNQQKLKELFL